MKIFIMYGGARLAKRFWDKVHKTDGCWEWTASLDRYGYGKFSSEQGQWQRAHRISWQLTHGYIPPKTCVLHRCDNPKCVNPEHLFLGTHADNMRDMYAKDRRRARRGESHGMARLSQVQVDAIRNLDANGNWTLLELATRFGVSQSTIWSVVNGKTWRAA